MSRPTTPRGSAGIPLASISGQPQSSVGHDGLASPLLSPRSGNRVGGHARRRRRGVEGIENVETLDFGDDYVPSLDYRALSDAMADVLENTPSTIVPSHTEVLSVLLPAPIGGSTAQIEGPALVYGSCPARQDVDPADPATAHVITMVQRDFTEAFGSRFLRTSASSGAPPAPSSSVTSAPPVAVAGAPVAVAGAPVAGADRDSASGFHSGSGAQGGPGARVPPTPRRRAGTGLQRVNSNVAAVANLSVPAAPSLADALADERIRHARIYAQVSFLESLWPTVARLVVCALIGATVAIFGWSVELLSRSIYRSIMYIIADFMHRAGHENPSTAELAWWAFMAIVFAGLITACVATLAIAVSFVGGMYPIRGSGVAHISAYLDGSFNRSLPIFTLPVLLTKALSVSLAIGASFKSGLQGPLIHLGGLIARQIAIFSVAVTASPRTAKAIRLVCCCLITKNNRCRRIPGVGRNRSPAGPFSQRVSRFWFNLERRFNPSSTVLVPDGSGGWGLVREDRSIAPVPRRARGDMSLAVLDFASSESDVLHDPAPAATGGVAGEPLPKAVAMANALEARLRVRDFLMQNVEPSLRVSDEVDAVLDEAFPFPEATADERELSEYVGHANALAYDSHESAAAGAVAGSHTATGNDIRVPEIHVTPASGVVDAVAAVSVAGEVSEATDASGDFDATAASSAVPVPPSVAAARGLTIDYDYEDGAESPSIAASVPASESAAGAPQALYAGMRSDDTPPATASVSPAPTPASGGAGAPARSRAAGARAAAAAHAIEVASELSLDGMLGALARSFAGPVDEHDFIACGAAAGFTAAFNAPLAGIVMMQGMAHGSYSFQLTLRLFFTALVAVIVNNLLNGSSSLLPDRGFIDVDLPQAPNMRPRELLLVLLLSILVSGFGVMFTEGNLMIARLRSRVLGHKFWANIRFGLYLSAAVVIPAVILASAMSCTKITPAHFPMCKIHPARCYRLACPPDHFSQIGTLALGSAEQLVRLLWDRTEDDLNEFATVPLALFFVLYTFLATLTHVSAAPGGFFMPAIIMGAVMGRLYSSVCNSLGGNLTPGVYAVLGSVGMLASINRLTLPLAVMMVEFTSDVQFLTPMMVTIISSKFIADIFVGGLETEEMKLRSAYLSLGERPHPALSKVTAGDIVDITAPVVPWYRIVPDPAYPAQPLPAGPVAAYNTVLAPPPRGAPIGLAAATMVSRRAGGRWGVLTAVRGRLARAPVPMRGPSPLAWGEPVSVNLMCCVGEVDTAIRIRTLLDLTTHAVFPVVSVLPALTKETVRGAAKAGATALIAPRLPAPASAGSGLGAPGRLCYSALADWCAETRRGAVAETAAAGRYVGLVSRRDLEQLLERSVARDSVAIAARRGTVVRRAQPSVSDTAFTGGANSRPRGSAPGAPHLTAARPISESAASRVMVSPLLRFPTAAEALRTHPATHARALVSMAVLYLAQEAPYVATHLARVAEAIADNSANQTAGAGEEDSKTAPGAASSSLASSAAIGEDGTATSSAVTKAPIADRVAVAATTLGAMITLPLLSREIVDNLLADAGMDDDDDAADAMALPGDLEAGFAPVIPAPAPVAEAPSHTDDDGFCAPIAASASAASAWLESRAAPHQQHGAAKTPGTLPAPAIVSLTRSPEGGRRGSVARRGSVVNRQGYSANVPSSPRAETGAGARILPPGILAGALPPGEASEWVNVLHVADRGAFVVNVETPGHRLWRLFRQIGMSRVTVVDAFHRPVAVISKKDMIVGERAVAGSFAEEAKAAWSA